MSIITFDKVIEVAEWLTNPKIDHRRCHIESRCPICGDSRTKSKVRRLHIDYYQPYNTFIYKCHRCGASGNVISLYATLNNCSYEKAKKFLTNSRYDPDYVIRRLKNSKPQEPNDEIKVDGDLDIDLCTECYSLDHEPKSMFERNALKKLKEFKESRKIPDSLPIYIAHSGRYKSRIIIPIYIENKLVYFQGRAAYDDVIPKYLNPKVEKNKIILNIDNFDENKYIVITEGIIDAYMLENHQGTCVIGGYIDMEFLNKVLDRTKKGVIICLDNPRKDDNSRKVLKKLINENINKYKENLKFFIIPKEYDAKDLNDLVKDYNINNVYSFVVENSVSLLRMKTFLMEK